jgi:16S rRNA (uracil1498-N3)-methyltransferase
MTPRLYINTSLKQGSQIQLEDSQLHYLRNVLRLTLGSPLQLFNGRDGEWEAHIETYSKKSGTLICNKRLRDQRAEVPLTLMCALIKPARLEFLIEKATELGISDIQPLVTDRCSIRKLNTERLLAHAVEAAEQSERLTIPKIHHILSLREAVLAHEQDILWADESREQKGTIVETLKSYPIRALLIGPEGGFSQPEKEFLLSQPKVHPVHMGPLILRAETAGIALISAYQTHTGAWR